MPPCAITSPKKKRPKRKGSDASGRAGLPKKSRQAADLTEAPSMPLVSLGLAEAGAADSAPQHSGCPNAGTGGRNRLHIPQFTYIPVNPQAPEPACKGWKSRPKAAPPPYSSLANGPALSIDNMGPSLSIQQPGGRFGFVPPPSTEHSLQDTNNPHVPVATTTHYLYGTTPGSGLVRGGQQYQASICHTAYSGLRVR
ncbi:hypothetical protein EDB19DRAFT_1915357 [Suillus lakei]|nr:hypothetical protein EDB19DRAFT_1915357 [Suillus lakei]